MLPQKLLSKVQGQSWKWFLGLAAMIFLLLADGLMAQDYQFNVKPRRLGDKVGADIYVKSLSSSAAKLGSFTFILEYNGDQLEQAASNYAFYETDSVDYDVNQSPRLPYREIESPFHMENGYGSMQVTVGSNNRAFMQVTFTGNASTDGIQPATSGLGSFVGRIEFDIVNHGDLADTSKVWFVPKTSPGVPTMSFYDVSGNEIDMTTDIDFPTPVNMTITGITILNPNGPYEAVNRSATYESLSGVAGYPIYFERSGLVNPSSYTYGTDALAYVVDYSLDGGSTWTQEAMRFAEMDAAIQSATYSNYASGEVQTKEGTVPGYSITKGSGTALTTGGDGYDGILRVIWDDDPYFPYRSENAKLRIVQLDTTGSGSDIDDRDRLDPYDISDAAFVLSRIFFAQLDGVDDYFKTSEKYFSTTQLTVEAWVNLNELGADGSEPGIVVCSNADQSGVEGPWMLYLADGQYPAFRAREHQDRLGGYVGQLQSSTALSVVSSDFDLGSDTQSENHRQNWHHIAATVKDDSVTLYVDGQIVDRTYSDSVGIRMMYVDLPVWVGVNPNPNSGIDGWDYMKAGVKEVKVWAAALSPDQILEHASGVYDPDGTITAISTTESDNDPRVALDLYYGFQGVRTDAADHLEIQYGNNALDFITGGSVDNTLINYRPDRAHIKVISPSAGAGVSNLENEYFTIKWIGYGIGSIAPGSDDIEIEYSRNGGLDWDPCNDSTTTPAGRPLVYEEIESGSAIWEPFNNVSKTSFYHDLQGVGNTVEENYNKQVLLRIKGRTANNQDNIYDISDPFWVAPHFALELNGSGYAYLNNSSQLNLSAATSFIEAWVCPYEFPEDGEMFPIVYKGSSDGNNMHYALHLLSTGQLQFTVADSLGTTSYTAISDTNHRLMRPGEFDLDSLWTHVGVLVNLANGSGQSSIRFYIDGVPQTTDDITTQLGSNIEINTNNTYPVYLGYDPSDNVDNYVGMIKEVRFWNGYPAGMTINTIDSRSNPSDLTKFIQGAQGVRADDLQTSPTNYQDNLVAAFLMDGGPFLNAGVQSTLPSTNSRIIANLSGDLGIGETGLTYRPTPPYVKLVEPIYDQIVPNSTTDLRVRWVGWDYDGINFRNGNGTLNQHADLEYSSKGGGSFDIQPMEYVASTNYNAGFTNALDMNSDSKYRFTGGASDLQYGAILNVSISDPDVSDDKSYDEQGPIPAGLKNPRLRVTARATINSEQPWEYTDFPTLRSAGPIFIITPPSNFTVRAILEGFHSGTDEEITDIGESFDNLGLKISLWKSVAGLPGEKMAEAESVSGYYEDATARSATTAPVRGSNGSKFANVPFIFTDINDGEYYVVVEHLNHLPIMSRYVADFAFSGDDMDTWSIESGWDFQSWGQISTPTATDIMNTEADDIYSGTGLFTAYGESEIDEDEVGFDITALNFTQGQETSTSNRIAGLVAGDVYRDGQINASDRVQVRDDATSNTHRSDVTGDGQVNALDRDIVDRNSGRYTELADINVVTFTEEGSRVEKPMFDWISTQPVWENVHVNNTLFSQQLNAAAVDHLEEGGKLEAVEYYQNKKSKGESALAGIDYEVSGVAKLDGNYVDVTLYIQNNGAEFAPGNCTFAITYDPNSLQFIGLADTHENPWQDYNTEPNEYNDYGYSYLYSAPTDYTPNPTSNVRTIEINYDGFTRKLGINLPTEPVNMGTLRFVKKTLPEEFAFTWHSLTKVLRTDGKDLTGNGNFRPIEPISITRSARIIAPNGGEQWRAGRTYDITWSKPTIEQNAIVQFSSDNGASWSTIGETEVPLVAQRFSWATPRISSSECLVRLINAESEVEIDRSDATFTIEVTPAEITRPACGDPIYSGGTDDFITWTLDDPVEVYFEFSENGLDGWQKVSTNINAMMGQVEWTIPVTNTKFAVIRMVNAETQEVLATSCKFRILAGTVELTSPRVNEKLVPGENKSIRWLYENVSKFDMQFSADGGQTWEVLALDVNALTSNYPWTVPNVNTDKAVIRALWNNDPEMEYSRTQFFVIDGNVSVDDLGNLGFSLERPVPNPFTTQANISFVLPESQVVTMTLYDATGAKVTTLINGQRYEAGRHTVQLLGDELANGLYIIHVNAGPFNMTREIMLVK